jgi:outer membrane protein assembly factor BamD (BamD/ComL family)
MKKSFGFVLLVLALMTLGCGQGAEKKKLTDRIAAGEAKIFGDSLSTIPDQNTGMEMIQAYTDFANEFPDDTASAEYLFKGAEIAMNMKMSAMAIEYYRRIIDSYPNYSKVAYCLFLQAFILENDLKQYDQAKQVYQDFVNKYPNHVLAKDALASIQNMGKPIEELIKEWEQQNKQ